MFTIATETSSKAPLRLLEYVYIYIHTYECPFSDLKFRNRPYFGLFGAGVSGVHEEQVQALRQIERTKRFSKVAKYKVFMGLRYSNHAFGLGPIL